VKENSKGEIVIAIIVPAGMPGVSNAREAKRASRERR
jgi:hypothetical protein